MENTRVYGIDIDKLSKPKLDIINNKGFDKITDTEFIEIAEQDGLVWSLNGFQNDFNHLNFDIDGILIRFIKN